MLLVQPTRTKIVTIYSLNDHFSKKIYEYVSVAYINELIIPSMMIM